MSSIIHKHSEPDSHAGTRPGGASDSDRPGRGHPLTRLREPDLDLIAELVLQSGSLKALAKSYGVSYPTIRARLDGVIRRTRDAVAGVRRDPLREVLGDLVERGQLSPDAARRIVEAARASVGSAGRHGEDSEQADINPEIRERGTR